MPKTFSEQERAFIASRILEETAACLGQYGIRKTTIDEIVRRVKIPKGTFYLFFESKERLIFEVILQYHDGIQQQLLDALRNQTDSLTVSSLTDILFGLFRTMDHSFFPRLMADGELAFFMGKLPPEWSAQHAEADLHRFEQLMHRLPGMASMKAEAFSAAFRGVFLTLLYKKDLGEHVYDDALQIMLRGIVIQLLEPALPGNDAGRS